MKLVKTEEMSFDKITEVLTEELPQYEVSLLKNPIARFEYVQVKKTGSVGVWVRIIEKKQEVLLIKAMPSALVRALFGGLLLILFVNGAQNKVRDECSDVLKKAFNTKKK
jgi:hypothetical protein